MSGGWLAGAVWLGVALAGLVMRCRRCGLVCAGCAGAGAGAGSGAALVMVLVAALVLALVLALVRQCLALCWRLSGAGLDVVRWRCGDGDGAMVMERVVAIGDGVVTGDEM
eukprot:gene662-2097_t